MLERGEWMHCGCLYNDIKRIWKINVALDDVMLWRLHVGEWGPRVHGRGRGHARQIGIGRNGGQVNVEARLGQH